MKANSWNPHMLFKVIKKVSANFERPLVFSQKWKLQSNFSHLMFVSFSFSYKNIF